MKVKDITNYLEEIAPLAYQESYDNSGLIVGDNHMEVKGIMLCLDSTEEVLDEAITRGCNMIIAHHPIVFSGLKKLNGKNYIERTVIKAIKNDVAIYAIHTNLDSVLKDGVSEKIGKKLGLNNMQILSPKGGLLKKLVTYCPTAQADEVRAAIFEAGAGQIGEYDMCSFNVPGKGTFRAGENSNPYVGEKGEMHLEDEVRIETIYPAHIEGKVLGGMIAAHPYEEVAYDIYPLGNKHTQVGLGVIGELETELSGEAFLKHLKESMRLDVIRYTTLNSNKIKKVAVCGGSGSFLLNDAKAKEADVLVTADFKYHQFFDGEGDIMIADIGHYESEYYTIELLNELITKKITNFAVIFTTINTNPVKYYS